jgi:hypothetical protein
MGFQPDGLLALGSTSIWKSFVVSDKFTRKPNICRATGVIKEDIFQGGPVTSLADTNGHKFVRAGGSLSITSVYSRFLKISESMAKREDSAVRSQPGMVPPTR